MNGKLYEELYTSHTYSGSICYYYKGCVNDTIFDRGHD